MASFANFRIPSINNLPNYANMQMVQQPTTQQPLQRSNTATRPLSKADYDISMTKKQQRIAGLIATILIIIPIILYGEYFNI